MFINASTTLQEDKSILAPVTGHNETHAHILYKFRLKRFSRFTFFFLNALVDIPICFRHVTSVRRQQTANLTAYFASILLQRGGYERTVKMLSSVLFGITTKYQNPLILPYLQHITSLSTRKLSRHLLYLTDSEVLKEGGYLLRIPVSWIQQDVAISPLLET
jgi:hypothetical protein